MDGDRTNITYYSDVRVDDKYRLGEVNGGWTVLRAALNVEHGVVERDAAGLQKIATMSEHGSLTAEAVDNVAAIAAKKMRTAGDCSTTSPSHTGSAAALPGWRLRSAHRRCSGVLRSRKRCATLAHLMDILGVASSLPIDADRAADDGAAEYIFLVWPSPTGVDGGTLEVFLVHDRRTRPRPGPPQLLRPAKR